VPPFARKTPQRKTFLFNFGTLHLATVSPWGSTQPLTEIFTRNILWGVKGAGARGLQVPTVWKSGSLNLLEPSWPVRHTCTGIA